MLRWITKALVELVRWPYLFFWWWIRGWRVRKPPTYYRKVIIAAAPHTSMWDYAHMLAAGFWMRRRPNVTVKSELFFPPLGWILKAFGGIPIDRSGSFNVVDQLAQQIKDSDEPIMLIFTPEGTRKYRDTWKTGFYYTALKADVPIIFGVPNYPEKYIDFDFELHPTGDLAADFEKIKAYFADHGVGLYPEKKNEVRLSERHRRRLQDNNSTVDKTNSTATDTTPSAAPSEQADGA